MIDYFSPNYLVIFIFILLHFIVLRVFFYSLLQHISAYVLVGLIFWRLFVTNFYWYYTLTENADTKRFYLETLYLNGGYLENFGTGTQFILFLLHPMVNFFEWSYYTCFYPFEFIGFLGVMFMLDHLYKYSGRVPKYFSLNILLILVFLPTFNFFTNSIGKDSLMFLGLVLTVTSFKNINTNWGKFIVGIFLIVFIRPHIFYLLLACIGGSLLLKSKSVSFWKKLIIFSGGITFSIFFMPSLLEKLALDELTTESFFSRIEQQNTYNQHSNTTINISVYNVPLRFLTFYFRPFFFDLNGFLSAIASIENILWLFMFMKICSFTFLRKLKNGSFLLVFHFSFFLLGGILLGMTINNVGLALRQKIMFLPSLLYLFSTWYNNQRTIPPS